MNSKSCKTYLKTDIWEEKKEKVIKKRQQHFFFLFSFYLFYDPSLCGWDMKCYIMSLCVILLHGELNGASINPLGTTIERGLNHWMHVDDQRIKCGKLECNNIYAVPLPCSARVVSNGIIDNVRFYQALLHSVLIRSTHIHKFVSSGIQRWLPWAKHFTFLWWITTPICEWTTIMCKSLISHCAPSY